MLWYVVLLLAVFGFICLLMPAKYTYYVLREKRDKAPAKVGHFYGGSGTIHGTQDVNVERDPATGKVVAVWYRCAMLPFTDTVADKKRAEDMQQIYRNSPPFGILGIQFSGKPAPAKYTMQGIGLHPSEEP